MLENLDLSQQGKSTFTYCAYKYLIPFEGEVPNFLMIWSTHECGLCHGLISVGVGQNFCSDPNSES